MELFPDPLHQLIASAGLIVVLFALLAARRRIMGRGPDIKLKRLLEKGSYEAAAKLELKKGNLRSALEYFMSAGMPALAAEVAHRMERPRQAAELYEEAGDLENAAKMYRKAGMEHRASDAERAAASHVFSGRGSKADYADEEQTLSPVDRAMATEREFTEAKNIADKGNAEALIKLADLGKATAESLLAIGETRRAADVFADAGLYDQAINLFVNLLGDPGAAAPLMAKRKDHKRAAELYEAAGNKDLALAAWTDWAFDASDPLLHISEIERLGNDRIFTFMNALIARKPPSSSNLELPFRIASALEIRNRFDMAADLLERIVKIDPTYRDASQKLARLAKLKAGEEAEPISQRSGSGAFSVYRATMPRFQTPGAVTARPSISGGTEEDKAFSAIEPPAIRNLVSEVSAAAIGKAHSLAQGSQSFGLVPPAWAQSKADGTEPNKKAKETSPQPPGMEDVCGALKYARDDAVAQARKGPSVDEILRSIGTSTPNPQNIELFYKLGLAHAAAGQWQDALNAFSVVHEINPKQSDARERANEIRQWQKTVPTAVTGTSALSDKGPLRYKLLGEIGRGAAAVVYRVCDEELKREAALKLWHQKLSEEPGAIESFEKRARLAAQLNHPNIVTVYNIGTVDGRAFACMEIVTGTTVKDLIEKDTRLRVIDALRITDGILDALIYAHARQTIHGDIKPSNVMRNELGVAKLMEFGFAATTFRTPDYMPPEQIEGKTVDERSDLFCVGAALYEMLSGKSPFKGNERTKPPEPLCDVNPAVPKILEIIVKRSLEFDREKRYKNAKEMQQPIRQILSSVTAYLSDQSAAESKNAGR